MNICFPARKSNGENYTDLKEIMDKIGREPHGSWLAGTNRMWHGGIHLTEVTAPGAVLSEENADKAVPLQCMADGEIVAWRINQDYLTSTYLSKPLQYSTTFLLVKSTCKPDPQQENTWLDFYSLYMGLAPLSAYPKRKTMTALKTVLRHPAGSYADSTSTDEVAKITPGRGYLNESSRIIVLKEAQFRNHGEVQPFGLVKSLNDKNEATGDAFWVTLLPEYMVQDGEQYAALPAWMQSAITQGGFNSVMKPSAPVTISAGDAVGFLPEDIAAAGMGKTSISYFAHIEVITTDPQMPEFLSNPGKVTTGKQYIRLGLHKPLYIRNGDTFEQISAITERDGGKVLERDKCTPQTSDGRTWYQIRPHTWMSQDDVDELHQFDLTEREFSAFAEPSTRDMQASLREGWVRDAFSWLAERVNPDKGMQQAAVSRYYKGMLDKLDNDHDGILSGRELVLAMHYPEMGVRRVIARMAVKHDSEWFGGSGHHRWETLFQNYDPLRIEYTKKWLDDSEWMSQVPPFDKGEAVWHMHPVVFLEAFREAKKQGWAHSPFAELLGSVESKNDYTAYNRTWPHPKPTNSHAYYNTNLTSMTLSQVMTAQKTHDMFATGRFQIIPDTLKLAVNSLNLDVNSLYDNAMQDRIFEEYLIKVKRKPIINYLEGDGSVEDAAYAWALEFASAGVQKGREISRDPKEFERDADGRIKVDDRNRKIHKRRWAQADGVSYYSGDGLNKAHIMPDEMISKLEASKNAGS